MLRPENAANLACMLEDRRQIAPDAANLPSNPDLNSMEVSALSENTFGSSPASLRHASLSRRFTNLVNKIPYVGDIVIQQCLHEFYAAQNPEGLRKAYKQVVFYLVGLQAAHTGFLCTIGSETVKDLRLMSRDGGFQNLAEVSAGAAMLSIFAAVSASEVILMKRLWKTYQHKLASGRFSENKRKPSFKKGKAMMGVLIAGAAIAGYGNTFDMNTILDTPGDNASTPQNTEME